MALTNAEKQAAWRARRDAQTRALENNVKLLIARAQAQEAEIERLRNAATDKKLQTKIAKLEAELHAERCYVLKLQADMMKWQYQPEMQRNGKMPMSTFTAVVKCLHPDSWANVTAKERQDACGLFIQWKQSQNGKR
jgi:hypothetical protein